MPDNPAKFVWYDLMTSDTKAAASFYEAVVGWQTTGSELPGQEYSIFSTGATTVSGLMALPGPDSRPSWMGYIGVRDVDAYTKRVAAAGGAVYVPPRDIPQVGRFSLVADPQGAVFYLFDPLDRAAEAPASTGATSRVCWHELLTTDLEAAFSLSSSLAGPRPRRMTWVRWEHTRRFQPEARPQAE